MAFSSGSVGPAPTFEVTSSIAFQSGLITTMATTMPMTTTAAAAPIATLGRFHTGMPDLIWLISVFAIHDLLA